MDRRLLVVWLALEAALYVFFITSDVLLGTTEGLFSRTAKFLSVFLAGAVSFFIRAPARSHGGGSASDRTSGLRLLQAAMLGTVLADLLLGILRERAAGITVFLVVQILYVVRHSRGLAFDRYFLVPAFVTVPPAAAIVYMHRQELTSAGILFPTILYAFAAVASLVTAVQVPWRTGYDPKARFFIPAGMSLFFLCDVNVGLYYAGIAEEITGFLVWVLYLPAQICLVLSAAASSTEPQ